MKTASKTNLEPQWENSEENYPNEFCQDNTLRHNFKLTHLKNYIGVTIIIEMDAPIETLLPQKFVQMPRECVLGAEALNLITRNRNLTELGSDLLTTTKAEYNSLETALDLIADSTHSRLINSEDNLTQAIQYIMSNYPVATELIQVLSVTGDTTLNKLAKRTQTLQKPHLNEYMLRSTESSDNLSETDYTNIECYNSAFIYQFKSLLCHAGILTTPGSDTTNLSPKDDHWKLDPKLDDNIKKLAVETTNTEGWR